MHTSRCMWVIYSRIYRNNGANIQLTVLPCFQALRTTYGCLLTELRKIENTHRARQDAAEDLEQLLGQLSEQLQHYIVARINTIALYPLMKKSWWKWKLDWWKNNSNFSVMWRFSIIPPICCIHLRSGKMWFLRDLKYLDI